MVKANHALSNSAQGLSKVEIWVYCGHPGFGVKIEQTAYKKKAE